jgi:hypothetical protein
MELTEYHYVYYSYEEYDRGYIGSRTCKCLPEEDINYFGSFKDKTFKPTQKIILKSDYATREEAYVDEIILQHYYKVVENQHFVNRAYQTSTKFYYTPSFEEASERGKLMYKNKKGIFGRSKEKINEDAKRSGKITKELGVGIFSLTKQELYESGKRGYENGLGKMSVEDRIKVNKKSAIKNIENKVGVFSISPEERLKIIQKVNLQKWECLETGFITNPGNLTKYQRARNIDTSKRKRIE